MVRKGRRNLYGIGAVTVIKEGTQKTFLNVILTLPDPTLILALTVTLTLTRALSLRQRQV